MTNQTQSTVPLRVIAAVLDVGASQPEPAPIHVQSKDGRLSFIITSDDGSNLVVSADADEAPAFAARFTPQEIEAFRFSHRSGDKPFRWVPSHSRLRIGNNTAPGKLAAPVHLPATEPTTTASLEPRGAIAVLNATAYHQPVDGQGHTTVAARRGKLTLSAVNPHTALTADLPTKTISGTADTSVVVNSRFLQALHGLPTKTIWHIGLDPDNGAFTVTAGRVHITITSPQQVDRFPVPQPDNGESGGWWDLDIINPVDLQRFLDRTSRTIRDQDGYVQIRNSRGDTGQVTRQISVTARYRHLVEHCGESDSRRSGNPIETTSLDEVAVDVPIGPLRALVSSAVALNPSKVGLRGAPVYQTMSPIFAIVPNGVVAAVARVPQPL